MTPFWINRLNRHLIPSFIIVFWSFGYDFNISRSCGYRFLSPFGYTYFCLTLTVCLSLCLFPLSRFLPYLNRISHTPFRSPTILHRLHIFHLCAIWCRNCLSHFQPFAFCVPSYVRVYFIVVFVHQLWFTRAECWMFVLSYNFCDMIAENVFGNRILHWSFTI